MLLLLTHCSDLPMLSHGFGHAADEQSEIQMCNTCSGINVSVIHCVIVDISFFMNSLCCVLFVFYNFFS